MTAVDQLVAILRVVVPLAASAQVGRCRCRRAIPWERQRWANPHCFECEPRDEADRTKLRQCWARAGLIVGDA